MLSSCFRSVLYGFYCRSFPVLSVFSFCIGHWGVSAYCSHGIVFVVCKVIWEHGLFTVRSVVIVIRIKKKQNSKHYLFTITVTISDL